MCVCVSVYIYVKPTIYKNHHHRLFGRKLSPLCHAVPRSYSTALPQKERLLHKAFFRTRSQTAPHGHGPSDTVRVPGTGARPSCCGGPRRSAAALAGQRPALEEIRAPRSGRSRAAPPVQLGHT